MQITPCIKNLIFLRNAADKQHDANNSLLRLMVCNEPFAEFVTDWLGNVAAMCQEPPVLAIPKQWGFHKTKNKLDIIEFTENLPVPAVQTTQVKDNSWLVISNGRFMTLTDNDRILQFLAETKADVISFNVVPDLAVSYEKVLTSSNKELVGFRLFYEEAIQPMPLPRDWPHHLFIKYSSLTRTLHNGSLPLEFNTLLELFAAKSLKVQNFGIGGSILDLAQDAGLLTLIAQRLSADYSTRQTSVAAVETARIFGRVLFGENVEIGANAIVAGPAIIGNNVKIGADAVIRMAVVGPDVSVEAGDIVEQKVLLDAADNTKTLSSKPNKTDLKIQWNISQNNFRNWEGSVYARHIKRIFDIIVSTVVLVLFAPFLPLIMLAVKLTSPGPVFFKHTRQGLHGKNFKCLKFRTMRLGAHKMQDQLRGLSKTDGPQFMIPDDPRITAVGKFLRETYLDEIPQFINVLMGQMSVVGPRPSPERENRLCPFWRDARLSVRPGVTGLWQVCRTRGHMRDFQEWIHYDIKYVRELSPQLDFLVCLQTAKKMAIKFISQF